MDKTYSKQLIKPAIFLDRDGVIIHNRANYVRSWEEVKIYPYSLPAIRQLSPHFSIFIITNQSPIGRGLLEEQVVIHINTKLKNLITEAGGRVDQIYYCPHAPQVKCSCRKPKPGMIHQAAADYAIELSSSWLIGDAISDIQAGINAGIPNNILLQTGRGKKQLLKSPPGLNYMIETNLSTAAKKILSTLS
jgi:D-glycero-D-manno-heptose 1,7-bisphosphate phosphatase